MYHELRKRGTKFSGVTAVPNTVSLAAAEGGLGSAMDLLARAKQFLSSLEPDQRMIASFAWNGSEWRGMCCASSAPMRAYSTDVGWPL